MNNRSQPEPRLCFAASFHHIYTPHCFLTAAQVCIDSAEQNELQEHLAEHFAR